jgi:hypothetical protein
MLKQTYRIEIDNADDTTSILYAQRPKCKTAKGRDRQHNNVVNEVVNAIREVRGWKRLSVAIVPAEELVHCLTPLLPYNRYITA